MYRGIHVGKAVCKGTTSRARLNPGDFLELKVRFPPVNEQQKIAAIISSVDETIQATRCVIEQTRTVTQGVLRELLTRGIGHTRFKQTEIGEVPEEWQVVPVGTLCGFSSGNGFKPSEWSEAGLPIIRIQNLNGSRQFNYYAGPTVDRWIIEPGELLFAWAGVKGVSFGPCIWSGPRGVLNQHIFRITPRSVVNKTWLFEALGLITARIETRAHGFKASLLHVRKGDISGALVGVPSPGEQAQIAKRASELREMTDCQVQHLESLQALKRGLMQNLLTGRVRVPID